MGNPASDPKLAVTIRSVSEASAKRLALPGHVIEVWKAELDEYQDRFSECLPFLSRDERERSDRFRLDIDRKRFAAGRYLLRTFLGRYLDADPIALKFSRSAKGKPFLSYPVSGIEFNVSHSAGRALLAFAWARPVGVDLECIREDRDIQGIAKRYFSPIEQKRLFELSGTAQAEAFFRCWSRKEAILKACGEGLSLPLNSFDVPFGPEGAVEVLPRLLGPHYGNGWLLWPLDAGPKFAAALAVCRNDALPSRLQGFAPGSDPEPSN